VGERERERERELQRRRSREQVTSRDPIMTHCEAAVDDEFELFRAQSYGVESALRHQRAASVRASSAKVKVTVGQKITPRFQ